MRQIYRSYPRTLKIQNGFLRLLRWKWRDLSNWTSVNKRWVKPITSSHVNQHGRAWNFSVSVGAKHLLQTLHLYGFPAVRKCVCYIQASDLWNMFWSNVAYVRVWFFTSINAYVLFQTRHLWNIVAANFALVWLFKFSPVWMHVWSFKWAICEKSLLQTLHLYGFSRSMNAHVLFQVKHLWKVFVANLALVHPPS